MAGHPNRGSNDAAPIVAGPEARAVADAPSDALPFWKEWAGQHLPAEQQAWPLLQSAFEAGWQACSQRSAAAGKRAQGLPTATPHTASTP